MLARGLLINLNAFDGGVRNSVNFTLGWVGEFGPQEMVVKRLAVPWVLILCLFVEGGRGVDRFVDVLQAREFDVRFDVGWTNV